MFGLPRSGTNLLTRMLNAHPDVMVAVHAFQPLFKSLRSAAIRTLGDDNIRSLVDLDAPVHDGHFDVNQRRALDLVHMADLNLKFAATEWPDLHRRLVARARDDAGDLCDGIASLEGATIYRELLDAALELVARTRKADDCRWVGMIDTWVIDLLPALARSYPEARFIVIERDPRAIANSMLGYLDVDPRQVGHILSVIRHWRKEGALLQAFQSLPELNGRLHRTRYEALATTPAEVMEPICEFLDIELLPAMLDLGASVDIPTGRKWTGNSTFDPALDKISAVPVERWRETLPRGARALVEFAAGPDMRLRGYHIEGNEGPRQNADALRFLLKDDRRPVSWRCDSEDPLVDYALEALRRDMLRFAGSVDEECVRRSFLYAEYFESLRMHVTP